MDPDWRPPQRRAAAAARADAYWREEVDRERRRSSQGAQVPIPPSPSGSSYTSAAGTGSVDGSGQASASVTVPAGFWRAFISFKLSGLDGGTAASFGAGGQLWATGAVASGRVMTPVAYVIVGGSTATFDAECVGATTGVFDVLMLLESVEGP